MAMCQTSSTPAGRRATTTRSSCRTRSPTRSARSLRLASQSSSAAWTADRCVAAELNSQRFLVLWGAHALWMHDMTTSAPDRESHDAPAPLHSREASFGRLLGGIRDCAIYMIDPQGHVTSWNAGAERIKGYTETEILGRHFSEFYTSEDRAAGKPAFALA